MKVTIIGAGLLGRLLAWQLLERGHAVTLLDKGDKSGVDSAGTIAAAMLAPISEVLDAEPVVYSQGVAGMQVWREWAEQLNATTEHFIELRLSGSVVVSHRNDSGDYQRFVQRVLGEPVIEAGSVQQLDRRALAELEPELGASFDRGCYLATEGCIDNAALYRALRQRIETLQQQHGGQWRTGENIEQIQAEQFDADYLLDCRGFGAHETVKSLRGVRGEVLRVHAPEVNLSRPVRLMHPRYKLYIAPKPNHEYIIGATQIESESEHPVTVRSSLELLSALYSVHKGFAEAEVLLQSARCRPAFNDNLPAVIRSGKLLTVNGLYRHGYLLSPSLVRQTLHELGVLAEACWPAIVEQLEGAA